MTTLKNGDSLWQQANRNLDSGPNDLVGDLYVAGRDKEALAVSAAFKSLADALRSGAAQVVTANQRPMIRYKAAQPGEPSSALLAAIRRAMARGWTEAQIVAALDAAGAAPKAKPAQQTPAQMATDASTKVLERAMKAEQQPLIDWVGFPTGDHH